MFYVIYIPILKRKDKKHPSGMIFPGNLSVLLPLHSELVVSASVPTGLLFI